jgi:hypothetical protein
MFKIVRMKLNFLILACLFPVIFSCKQSSEPVSVSSPELPPMPNPKNYVSYRTNTAIVPDGILNEKEWDAAPWTDYFEDIQGSAQPVPRLKTHAKLLWDDTNLYIAAEMEEPHVWSKLKQRDTVVFYDNDFEVFIDPDGDTHAYYELEVNALETEWDLLLLKPYRDGGQAVNGWDISGLKTGVKVNGTINNPADTDKGWTVELKIPLSELRDWRAGKNVPAAGSQWRLGFSRVEWRTIIENGAYKKEINPATGKPFPEDNWVWSPQGRIDMHMPEMWGYLQFSSKVAGEGTDEFITDADFDIKWALRMIYYAENEYFKKNNKYSASIEEIGLKPSDLPEGYSDPVIEVTRTTFESYFPGDKNGWTIYHDGRIINRPELEP